MSSGSILPTFGAAPPNIRRASIPRDLQPDIPDAAKALRRRPEPPELPESEQGSQPASGRPLNVSGTTAISAQAVQNVRNTQNAQNVQNIEALRLPEVGSPSPGSRRIEQAIEAAAAADEDVNAAGLTDEEQAYVRELQAIDREVRAHEAAHAATGGAYAGRPTYEYVTGPDGIRYAVSGRVQIDTGVIPGDPEGTIRKLETVRRSALAPAKPSGQDRAVAAQAEAGIRAAQSELNAKRAEETDARLSEATESAGTGTDPARDSVAGQIARARENPPEEDGTGLSRAESLVAQTAFNRAAFNRAAFNQAAFAQTSDQTPFGQAGLAGSQGADQRQQPVDLLA